MLGDGSVEGEAWSGNTVSFLSTGQEIRCLLPSSLLEGMRAQAQLWEIRSAEGLTSLSWSYLSKVSQWRTTLSETTGDAMNTASKLSAR